MKWPFFSCGEKRTIGSEEMTWNVSRLGIEVDDLRVIQPEPGFILELIEFDLKV